MNLSTLCEIQANRKLHGRLVFRGLNISVETKKGATRKGVSPSGKKWSVKMTWPYGYIRNTMGVDGDHVDCFIGPNEQARLVYVMHVNKAGTFDKYDEDKCMLGFNTAKEAKQALLENYSDPRFFGGMDAIPFEQFKESVLKTKAHPQKLAASKLEQAMEVERVKAFGEPDTYGGGMAHIEPEQTFHPPSARKKKPVPTDDPMEKDDQFLDVTKRKSKDTKKFRDQQTKKHNDMGGIPPNTAVNHHTAMFLPFVTQQ